MERKYLKLTQVLGSALTEPKKRKAVLEKRVGGRREMELFLETERLYLRKMDGRDADILLGFMGDIRVMYAWERAFSMSDVLAWIDKRESGYTRDGTDYFLAVDKSTQKTVGQIGLLREFLNGQDCFGLGWILCADETHKGYATEGGRALADYAFRTAGLTEIFADIRPENTPSVRVAKRLGMKPVGTFDKTVYGKVMPHDLYRLTKEEFFKAFPHSKNRSGGNGEI